MGKKKRRCLGSIYLLLAAGTAVCIYLAGQGVEKPGNTTVRESSEQAGTDSTNSGHAMEPQDIQQIETENIPVFSQIREQKAGTILETGNMSAEMLKSLFYSQEITEEIYQRIQHSSYQENPHISTADLRYLRVLHMGFDGQTYIGELIVNQKIEQDILEIMKELYENSYPIEKMILIDEYGAEDEVSMSDNNTSAFNYRKITGSSKLSKHSMGLAIDINPKFNPCVRTGEQGEVLVEPANGLEYADRLQEFSYKIDEGDLCLQLFLAHGFTWGGNWNSLKDYQHFEK